MTTILISSSAVFVDWSQSCTNLSNAASLVGMSEPVTQHVHQESHTPRPNLGLRFHHETFKRRTLVHARIVTLVQRGSCNCHPQNAEHLGPECAFFAAEGCVEILCRQRLCHGQLLLSTASQRLRGSILNDCPRTSSDLRRAGLAFRSPVCRPPCPHACSDLLPPSEEGPQTEIRSYPPDPVHRHHCGIWICIGQGLQDMTDALASRLVFRAHWKGAVAASTFLAICFAIVRTTSLRMMSPKTIPLTPPSGFWNAVNLPNLMAWENGI